MINIPEFWIIMFLFLGVLLILVFIGLPIAYGLGVASIVVMVSPYGPDLSTILLATQLFQSLNSFVFLAFPFYILLGKLMNEIGVTKSIFEFANAVIGHVRGGLGYVNVTASIIFSGMSGLAIADVASLGRIEYEAMRSYGYPKDMTLGITTSSSIIGPIMPPSIIMIVYAVLAEVSIGAMFLAGVVPAFLMGLSIMILIFLQTVNRGMEPTKDSFSLYDLWESTKEALPAVLIPVLIIGGILSGIMTATEAGAVAVVYVIILGFIYYGSLSTKDIVNSMKEASIETFAITFILANATLYGLVALQLGLPVIMTEAIVGFTENTTIIMLMMIFAFIVIGTFMEKISAVSLLVPILAPAIGPLGIDPIHFGVVMVSTLMVGALTPPVGGSIYALEKVTDASIKEILVGTLPFYFPLLIVCVIVALFPEIALYVPTNFM